MKPSTPLMLGMVLGSALIATPMVWADTGASCSGGRDQAMSHHRGHGHGSATNHLVRHLMKNKQEIGLSEEQITKLRTVALESDRARIRAVADMKVSERELRSLLWDEKVEMPAIEAKVKEKESLEAAVRIIGIKAKRDLIGVLTAEQKTKLRTLWNQHRQDRRHMMHAETDEFADGSHEADSRADMSEFGATDGGGKFSAG